MKDGEVLATAFRGELRPGDHAEFTLLEGKLGGVNVSNATVYTTLEPCTIRNHSKVPCAERLAQRRIGRVVIGILDPNPEIRGLGQQRLRDARITTDLFPDDLMAEIEDLNRAFRASFPPPRTTVRTERRSFARNPRFLLAAAAMVTTALSLTAYTFTGSEALREDVYRPLLKSVSNAAPAFSSVSVDLLAQEVVAPPTELIDRTPEGLRTKLAPFYADGRRFFALANAVHEVLVPEVSARVLQLRTEAIDSAWRERTIAAFRQATRSQKGVPDTIYALAGTNHEYIGRGFDSNLHPVSPGGPVLVLRDWLEFPDSLMKVQALWTDLDYLYLNPRVERWCYQITREDLDRANVDLLRFLLTI